MPGPTSEPEKYTIDEMLDRLSPPPGASPPDGELVTRADGSQAIRVRKRKRRTSQPHKEQQARSKRMRISLVVGGLVGIVALSVGLGAYLIYANSAPFRKDLSEKLTKHTGAEVKFHQFRINPSTANAAQIQLQWPPGNVVSQVTLKGIRADTSLTSFFTKEFSGTEFVSLEGNIDLSAARPGAPQFATNRPGAPFPAHFDRFSVLKLNAKIGEVATISKTEASLYPRNPKGNSELRLTRGTFTAPGWPALRIDRGLLETRGQDLELISLSMLHATDDRGSLLLSGTLHPLSADRSSTLSVKAEYFQLSGIIGGSLDRFFGGRIDTKSTAKSNYLTLEPTASQTRVKLVMEWTGAAGSQIDVNSLPFLYSIAQATEESWFEHPIFLTESEGIIQRDGETTTLSNLRLSTKGRMAIKGRISVDSKKALSGQLQVGLADSVIQTSAIKRLDEIFGEASEGFRWVDIELGGTVDAPTDNFSKLFSAAEPSQPPQDDYKGSSFEELTRPRSR